MKDQEFQNLQEENELLLLQLHQVQEELEYYYLLVTEGSGRGIGFNGSSSDISTRGSLSSDLDQLLNELRKIQKSVSWRITGPYRRLARILKKRTPIQNSPPGHLSEAEKVEYLRWRLSEMRSSTSMRLTQPLRKVQSLFGGKKIELENRNTELQRLLEAETAKTARIEYDLRKEINEAKNRQEELQREKEELQREKEELQREKEKLQQEKEELQREKEELMQRQVLFDEEIAKAEAQIDLIKELLLGEVEQDRLDSSKKSQE